MVRFSLAALLPVAAAFPAAMEINDVYVSRRATGRLNTGAGHPNPTFNAKDQYVNVSPGSANEFRAPRSTDLRGQCPGLNAAANHGFLPRTGLATILDTVTGLEGAYNMSPDLAAGLAAIAILISGDIPSGRWSIGGGFPSTVPLLLSDPKGIVGTHNKYEGDASIVRGDAYLNNGNVGVFQKRSWDNLMKTIGNGNDLTLDLVNDHNLFVHDYSLNNNPYYFSGPLSGLVTPAAHNFVVNFMSNHSAENPGGFLTKEVLRSFFSVKGNDKSYTHAPGQERIPEGWYKRPGGADQYNLADVFLDLAAGATNHGELLAIGGNTGKTNTFTGINLGDLTGGTFNAQTLLTGNNLACFFFRAAQAGNMDQLNGLTATLGDALKPILAPLQSIATKFQCPQLAKYNTAVFDIFPGYNTKAYFWSRT